MILCRLKNLDIHYEACGTGRPLICLHGFSPDHRLMTGCLEPIFKRRSGWQRIYPDLPGMGQTPGPAWLTHSDQMLEMVLEFIDQVIPGRRFALAGESYGGYLARGIVARRPDLVDGLLLICPLMFANQADRMLPPQSVLVTDPMLLSSLEPADREAFVAVAVVQTQPVWERSRDEVMSGIQIADKEFLSRLQMHGYAFSFDVDTTPFAKPTLLLTGRQDTSVGYRDAWQIVENYPRGTYVVLDRAGHNLQIEQPALFQSLVDEWLDRVEECW